jgi:hypothetical protein
VLNLIFIYSAHHHLMVNLSLLQQTASGQRRGCQQQHNKQTSNIHQFDAGHNSRKPLSRSSTEDDLIWLIQVGVLRREVDGQGLTERVRLTPMGRDLLDDWDDEIPTADAVQVMHHWLRRHRPRL